MGKKKNKKRGGGAAQPTEAASAREELHVSTLKTLDADALQTAAELQLQEMEVLAAIFDQDLVVEPPTPLFAHIFSITVRSELETGAMPTNATTGGGVSAELLLHFDLGRGYPLAQVPSLVVERRHGLSDEELAQLSQEMTAMAREKVGDVMIYDLVMHATEFLQAHGKDQSSFFDQMMQRQQDREEERKREADEQRKRQEAEAQAQHEEILAMIDAERQRRKEDTLKKRQSARRRRRRHRSSIDLQGVDGRAGHGGSMDSGSEQAFSDDGYGVPGMGFRFGSDGRVSESEEDNDDNGGGGGGEAGTTSSDAVSSLRSGEANKGWSGSAEISGELALDTHSDGSSSTSSDVEARRLAFSSGAHPHSRYLNDFKELGLLGRGGGGEVVKVRNRLDRQLYAVKKVKLDPDDPTMKKKILREVKTISRMQHRHIVRYFQAWIEGVSGDASSGGESDSEFGDESSDDDDDYDDDSVGDSGRRKGHTGKVSLKWQGESESNDEGDCGVCGDDDDDDEVNDADADDTEGDDEEDDWLGAMNNSSIHLWSKSNRGRRRRLGSYQSSSYLSASSLQDDGFEWEALEEAAEDGDEDGKPEHVHRVLPAVSGKPRGKKMAEKLYIQMEYCEGNALREVIDKGSLWQNANKIWTLFRQILEAIVYIHGQGIIHRDIKPPNIFLDAEGTVKLGDFGLAVRPPRSTEDDDDEELSKDEEGIMPSAPYGSQSTPGTSLSHRVQSTGSSAAELAAEQYERLKLENLESTRMTPLALTIDRSGRLADSMATATTAASYDLNENITTGVGTAFYRAPEQEREGQRYNHKADMFSLGVLFFEMWSPPFTTLMERAQALTGLREAHRLPESFLVPDNVKKIILWLCEQSPGSRPTAAALLASDLLPPKMEVEGIYLREALDTLANPRGKFYGQLIDVLLTQEPVNHIDYTYDHRESVKMKMYMNELRTRTYVKGTIQAIFERHGAVEHATPLLMPRTEEHNYTGIPLVTPRAACSLIDGGGVSVTLPFDLTVRLARFVARHNITRLKCYQFDRVYRKSDVGGGHPREYMDADFDIIWDDQSSFRALELEALQITSEVLQSLSTTLGSYYLRLNDARITRALLELSGVIPPSGRRELLKLLANEVSMHIHSGVASRVAPALRSGRWKFVVKKMLEHGVSQPAIDACRPFFLLPVDSMAALDTIEMELKKLYAKRSAQIKAASVVPVTSEDGDDATSSTPVGKQKQKQRQKQEAHARRLWKDASEGIVALRQLLQAMAFLRLKGPVCVRIDIGLSPRPERFASGFIFQAVLLPQTAAHQFAVPGGKTSTSLLVIAEGGRYDQLVTRFKLPVAYMKASHVAAMGVRFSVHKIVSCIVAAQLSDLHSTNKSMLPFLSTCDAVVSGTRNILVCSAGKASDTVLLRLQIALQLWSQGIGADFLHPDPLHLEDLEEYCAQQAIPLMLIVQTHMMRDKKQVKCRLVCQPSESDTVVNLSSLPEFMQERLRMLGKGGANDSSGGSRFHGHDTLGSGMNGGGGGGGGGGISGVGIGGSGGGAGGDHYGSAAVTLQPVFDVRVVDGKHYSKEHRNYRHQDNQKVVRRVSKWITSSFSGRGEDAMKVLSVDLPFGLMRELSSALMDHGAGGVELVTAAYPRYRKQVRYTADELLALQPTSGGRERYLLLHSLVDDRYDIMSLVSTAKSNSRKADRDPRHLGRRTP